MVNVTDCHQIGPGSSPITGDFFFFFFFNFFYYLNDLGSNSKPTTPSTPSVTNKRKSLRPTLGKKFRGEDDSDDLTRDMDDPPSDTNLREVEVPKPNVGGGSGTGAGGAGTGGGGASNTRKDSDWMPSKGAKKISIFL